MLRCPTCRKHVAPRLENECFPFCSERCRVIDLGKWLEGSYRIPVKPEENEDEQSLPAEDADGSS